MRSRRAIDSLASILSDNLDDTVQVRLLGSLDVTAGGVPRPVPGNRRKAVLAVLALRAGEIVSRDWLIEAVWADHAPATVTNSLQRHVSYLRDVLDVRGAIVARAPGYVLQLSDEATDVQAVERLIRHSGQTADRAQAAARLRTALSLWRGEALADVRGHGWLEEQAQRLDELRHGVVRELVEARLALGEHAPLIPELQHRAQRYPLDEDVHRQLMLALHRTGRQAEALATFARLRATLGAELGIDPAATLRELHTAILRHDPALDPPAAAPVTVARAQPVPAARSPLIGRVEDLESIGHRLRHHRLVTSRARAGSASRRWRRSWPAAGGPIRKRECPLWSLPPLATAPMSSGPSPRRPVSRARATSPRWPRSCRRARWCWSSTTASTCSTPAPRWSTLCWTRARGYGSWPPVASRWASTGRWCTRSGHSAATPPPCSSRGPRRPRAGRYPWPAIPM